MNIIAYEHGVTIKTLCDSNRPEVGNWAFFKIIIILYIYECHTDIIILYYIVLNDFYT